MVVLSKELFDVLFDEVTCKAIYHRKYERCIDFIFWYSILGVTKGVLNFYIPVYLLELLTNRKKIRNKDYLKKQLINFIRSTAYGITMVETILFTACSIRHLTGRFYYLTFVFLPGFLSGFSIFLENPKLKVPNIIMFSITVLESIVNHLKGEDIIKDSVNRDTLFFMITNAFFMYLYKTNKFSKRATLFWFLDPRPKEAIEENKCCNGNYKCLKHILNATLRIFGTGYAVFAVKALIGKLKSISKKHFNIVQILFSKGPINSGLFFGMYVLIYELTCRYLRETGIGGEKYHSLLAGLLAGLSYRISPNTQMNLMPLVLTMQLLWINVREIYKIPRWIFPELYFALCCGILLHFKYLKPYYCPKYYRLLVNTVMREQSADLDQDLADFLERKIKEKSVPITKYMYVKGNELINLPK